MNSQSRVKHPRGLTREEIKTLGLSSLGGMLEFYDFIIFVFFAQYISIHFFPQDLSDFWKSLNTYGAFAAGYLARPIGGVIMGHFGDKMGRKKMFILSILLMVIPTLSLGLVPTFETLGYGAPIFLLCVRILQGIAIGGELPGAWVFVYEHAPLKSKGLYLGVLTASVVGGILLGSLVALGMGLFFSEEVMRDWGWRVPFLLGGGFGILSVYLRRFLDETPVFQQMQQEKILKKFPLKEVLKTSKKGVILSMLSTWVLASCIVIIVLFLPNFIQDVFALSNVDRSLVQIQGIIFLILGSFMAGALSDKIGTSKAYCVWALYLSIASVLFFYAFYQLQNDALAIPFYMLLCHSVGVVIFTPIIMCGAFSAAFKFSGISFSYNIAYAIVGGFTPQLAFALHTLGKAEGLGSYGLSAYFVFLSFIAYGIAYAYAQWMEKKAS